MRKNQDILRTSCLATALAASFPAWPQAAAVAAITTTDPVVIIGVAPSAPLTFTTDPKIPRQPLPASDGTDYLKTIPGFSAIRNGGTNGDPVLRGMFGSRLNILTNGSSMPGACPARMDAPSSYISPENFDKLTVIKGPQTVLWGPGASAGTIRFDRDPPHFTQAGVRFDGSLLGGSFGRNDQTADLTIGNDKVYTRFIANHSHAQDYKDGDGNLVPSRWDKWNADMALGFTPDPNTFYELSAGIGDGQARYAGRGMDGSQFKRESFGLRFEKRHLGSTLDKLEAQVYYNYADHVMDNYTLRMPAGGNKSAMDVDRATWGGRVAATWNLSQALNLVTGLDFQQSRHRSRMTMGGIAYHDQRWDQDARFANTGLFGELTWNAAQDSRVIGGARVDWSSAKDFRATSGMSHDHGGGMGHGAGGMGMGHGAGGMGMGMGHGGMHGMMMMPKPNPTAGERRTKTLPSGFVRYEQDLAAIPATVYAGLGHAQRFPDYWELFSPKTGPAGSVNAFSGIKPEKTTQLDFGAQYKTETLDAWLSGYAGYVNDFILFSDVKGMMGSTSTQADNVNARIAGGELGLSYQIVPGLKLGTTLAYAWGQNRSDGRALPQIPPLEAKFSAAYDDGTWSAGALWRLVAAQRRYALNQGNVVGKDFGPSTGFSVVSLNGGYAISKLAQLSLGVDNLFDKTYAEHLNLAGNAGFGYAADTAVNEPGRIFWLRLNVKY